MSKYMEMIFIDSENQARLTGVGAEFKTDKLTVNAFESARHFDIGMKECDFILDLHEDNGDLIDSIGVSAGSFAQIAGEPVLSEAQYIAIDNKENQALCAA